MKTDQVCSFQQKAVTLISFVIIALVFVGLYWLFIGQFEEQIDNTLKLLNLNLCLK